MSKSPKYESQKGFTLIELLIVIGVIGVLAAALLVALNPIEQLNRARDAGAKSDAVQLYKAAVAAYIANGSIVTPDNSYGSQQPLVNTGDLKTILNDSNGGPIYETSVNANWIGAGDFEVGTGWLVSQQSLQAAKAQSDASSENCGSGSTLVQYYTYYAMGGQWHYWCNHP